MTVRTLTEMDRIDEAINAAWLAVGTARRAWVRSPNAITRNGAKQAEAKLNGLLEQRYALQQR